MIDPYGEECDLMNRFLRVIVWRPLLSECCDAMRIIVVLAIEKIK